MNNLIQEKLNRLLISGRYEVEDLYDAMECAGFDLIDEFLAIVRRHGISVKIFIDHIDLCILANDLPHNWNELPEKLTYLRSFENSFIKQFL